MRTLPTYMAALSPYSVSFMRRANDDKRQTARATSERDLRPARAKGAEPGLVCLFNATKKRRQGSARVRNWASEGSGLVGRELGARNREIRPGGSIHHIMDHHSEESSSGGILR